MVGYAEYQQAIKMKNLSPKKKGEKLSKSKRKNYFQTQIPQCEISNIPVSLHTAEIHHIKKRAAGGTIEYNNLAVTEPVTHKKVHDAERIEAKRRNIERSEACEDVTRLAMELTKLSQIINGVAPVVAYHREMLLEGEALRDRINRLGEQ